MFVKSNEFGAPWNDQCYKVDFYLSITFEELDFKSNQLSEEFCLPGPRKYSEIELENYAKDAIKERYEKLFKYDNFFIHIINIS